MSENSENSTAWTRPSDVMALHRLRQKKKALQARMNRTCVPNSTISNPNLSLNITKSTKRSNPFVKNNENKRPRNDISHISSELSESSDSTLFNLLHPDSSSKNNSLLQDTSGPLTSFTSVLNKLQNNAATSTCIVATPGEKWIPIDWTLKHKLRLMSPKPFAWNKTLKTSEEASGITGFVRCLDTQSDTSLDTSPNAQFHQCCLYWQHPVLPWLNLFPRSHGRVSATVTNFASSEIKETMQIAWSDSLRSLFQLLRARQCPYFYFCANSFTACFRAAGICGYSEMHVILTPTTRGFRHLLRQEDIAFTMPLKNKRRTSDGTVDLGYDTLDNNDESQAFNDEAPIEEEDCPDEAWLSSLGVNAEEIRKINAQQAKINRKNECEVDNSDQSLIFVEGVEVHGLYDFLINCKSIITTTGPLAGVPPTLLSPVAFHGASLQSLKVKESRIRDNNSEYYSIELTGPILPHTLHNLYSLLPKDTNVTATFANITSTAPFSKVKCTNTNEETEDEKSSGNTNKNTAGIVIFGEKNLSDCGLNKEILRQFCSANPSHIQHYDSLKYTSDTGLYVWL